MGIVDEDIVRVRESADIVSVISDHLQLKRVGRRWVGLCPFHAEKSGSFSVNQEQGLYYCFGCGAKGDVITFVREIEHTDFVGAVEFLAGKTGITLTYTDRDEGEGRKKRARLLDATAQAVEWYHQRLLSAPDAAAARSYLRSRGLSGDEVRAYQIGWAPEGWDELSKALKVPADVLVDAGSGPHQSGGEDQRRVPGPGAVPHLRRQGRRRGLRGAGAARLGRSGQVQELRRERHLRQEQGPVRAQLGQRRHRGRGRGHRVRGLHRRDRLRRRRGASGGGHLWHGPHRGALPHAQELRSPRRARLRRRRRRPERRRPLLRMGAGLRHRRGRGRPATRRRPRRPGPIGP